LTDGRLLVTRPWVGTFPFGFSAPRTAPQSRSFDTLLVYPRSRRPVGYSYTTDMPRDEYFDTQMSNLQRFLDAVLPGAYGLTGGGVDGQAAC
jgi:hypothetical protein